MDKKITAATFKSFVRKNRDALLIKHRASFDAMTDCVQFDPAAAFAPIQAPINSHPAHDLGIAGAWLVGRSRDYFNAYNENGLLGIAVSNCCGSFTVAVRT